MRTRFAPTPRALSRRVGCFFYAHTEGCYGLNEKRHSGRPRKLNGAQIQRAHDCVTLRHPQQFRFEYSLWTLKMLRNLIQNRWKLELSASSLSRLPAQAGAECAATSAPGRPEGRGANGRVPERHLYGGDGQGHECPGVPRRRVGNPQRRTPAYDLRFGGNQTRLVRHRVGCFGMAFLSAVPRRADLRLGMLVETTDAARLFVALHGNPAMAGPVHVREWAVTPS